jgi:hypothetical protein
MTKRALMHTGKNAVQGKGGDSTGLKTFVHRPESFCSETRFAWQLIGFPANKETAKGSPASV